MGCAPSSAAQQSLVLDETRNTNKVSPETSHPQRPETPDIVKVNQWPKPCPPGTNKNEVFNLSQFQKCDSLVQRINTSPLPKTFETLVGLLCKGATSDLQRVKALYLWSTKQDLSRLQSVPAGLDTPMGYLAAIEQKVASYSGLFLILCMEANVPCVTIEGIAKAAGYEPGVKMNSDSHGHSWNAVLIGKYWRLIDVNWGARSLSGDAEDDWNLIDADFQSAKEKKDVTLEYTSNDYYFLTDPKEFIYCHYPDDMAWQLLEKPISLNQFENQAYLKEYFHKQGLSIISHPLAVIESRDGETDIQFALPMNSHVSFRYQLFAKASSSSEFSNATKLKQFVIQQTKNKIISFNLFFPFKGQFKIMFYAGNETLNWICSYIINCTKAKTNCQPLPNTSSNDGFGPGRLTTEKGLLALSHQSGVILTSTGQVEVRFRMEKGLVELLHHLHSNSYTDDQLENYCVHRIVNEEVIISVNLPSSGDYTLDIFAKLAIVDSTSYDFNCSYLIRCTKPGISNPPFATTYDKKFGLRPEKMKAVSKKGLKFKPDDPYIITDSGEVAIEIESEPSIKFHGQLELNSKNNEMERIDGHVFYERTNNLGKLLLTLPYSGFYTLVVFAGDKRNSGNLTEVFNYLINCTTAHADLIKYPLTYTDWTEDYVLFEPRQGLLPNDEEIDFSVSVPGAHSVYVINEEHEKLCDLVKSPDGSDTWEGIVNTGKIPGDLYLVVKKSKDENAMIALKFEVLTKEDTAKLLQGVNNVRDSDDQDQKRLKDKQRQLMKQEQEREVKLQQQLKDMELEKERALKAEADANALLLELREKLNEVGTGDGEKVRAEQGLQHAREEAEERKRERIRKQMKLAIKRQSKRDLVKALGLFEQNEVPDLEGDYFEGRQMLQYFDLKGDLLKAVKSRDAHLLHIALDAVQKSSRDIQNMLELETAKAERVLKSLGQIEKMRHAIMKLDQRTVAEIKNYSSPPEEVHQVFKATLLLLGTPLNHTEKWLDCLVHIGKLGNASLKRRINDVSIAYISRETADMAGLILQSYSKERIQDVSSGAAAFYVWSVKVIAEVIDKEEDEDDFADSEYSEDDY